MLRFWRKWRESRRRAKAVKRLARMLQTSELEIREILVRLHEVYYDALLMAAQNAQKEGED